MQPKYIHYLCVLLACCSVLLGAAPLRAQGEPPKVQLVTDRIHTSGEIHVYRLADLAAGDMLQVTMRTDSGNLDPFVAVLDGDADLAAVQAQYQRDAQQMLATGAELAAELQALRDRYFLQWDDDGGPGYAAAMQFDVPAGGDYQLLVGGSLSTLGRRSWGDYTLTVGVNAPDVLAGAGPGTGAGTGAPTGATIVVRDRTALPEQPRVSEAEGSITAAQPARSLALAEFAAGDILQIFVEATGGDLRPVVILRDFGGKPLAVANWNGEETKTVLEHRMAESGTGYAVEIAGAAGPDAVSPDAGPGTGEFRAVIGFNAPGVLTGAAAATELPSLQRPTEVQLGISINRISEVDSTGEDFTVIGSIRMDWQDPLLAFSPDTCNCNVKLYTEKEFDRFLAAAQSRWPDFTFFNQQANRWTQNRAVAVWPDGRTRYVERFTTTFQADFDFRLYPFDVQQFPIIVDMILPDDIYQLAPLADYSSISPDHGEDEFVVGALETESSVALGSTGTDRLISRLTYSFAGPRHLNYYILQVFVPILLIILISWFTFFLKDYGRRIEAAAANILLFIAFSFSLANNYPRLGYITFLDAVMAVTFIVNTLVLLYNVLLKRMEGKGETARVERIDRFFDWAYPLSYLVLIAGVALLFFRPF